MGRKSREKRQRREHGVGPVGRVAHGRSRASLLALLEAASVSPNASQYLPSFSVIFESLASRRIRMGDKHAGRALLDPLVRAAHQECPSVAAEEDFLPHDPRFDVRVDWSGEMFRMVAGTLERPTSDVETLRLLAATVDPVLREHARYGLTDIVELVLRRVDAVAGMLAPTWPSDLERKLRSPPQLRPEELAAAAQLPPMEDQIAQCSDPERVRAALEAHSVPAKTLRREAMPMVATFGSTIAVRHGQRGFTPLPAGLMVEALNGLAGELAAKSLALDPALDERWRQEAWKFVRFVCVGAGNDVIGPLRDERHAYLHSVIRYSDSQHLAVGVAAGMDHMPLQTTIAAAAGCLEEVRPGSTLRTRHGTESIPDSARLSRLLIVAAPQAPGVLPHPIRVELRADHSAGLRLDSTHHRARRNRPLVLRPRSRGATTRWAALRVGRNRRVGDMERPREIALPWGTRIWLACTSRRIIRNSNGRKCPSSAMSSWLFAFSAWAESLRGPITVLTALRKS